MYDYVKNLTDEEARTLADAIGCIVAEAYGATPACDAGHAVNGRWRP